MGRATTDLKLVALLLCVLMTIWSTPGHIAPQKLQLLKLQDLKFELRHGPCEWPSRVGRTISRGNSRGSYRCAKSGPLSIKGALRKWARLRALMGFLAEIAFNGRFRYASTQTHVCPVRCLFFIIGAGPPGGHAGIGHVRAQRDRN